LVYALARVDLPTAQILAYLRAVGRALPETISERTGKSFKTVMACLKSLQEVRAVLEKADKYELSSSWRNILPEIVAIEAKVTDWRKAISQAARNRIFAHKSFVALPEGVARRVRREALFAKLGIGILGVDGDDVRVVKLPRRHLPRAWTYYYQLAEVVANYSKRTNNVVPRTHSGRSGRIF
jgi:hypothetical protein